MDSRFLTLGVVGSIALHVVLFSLFTLGSCEPCVRMGDPTSEQSAAAVETNETDSAGQDVLKSASEEDPFFAVPVRPTEIAPGARRESKPVSKYRKGPRPDSKLVTEAEPKTAITSESKQSASAEGEREWVTYVVKRGDRLLVLAKRAGCTEAELAKKNKKTIAALRQLKVGQRILIPKHR